MKTGALWLGSLFLLLSTGLFPSISMAAGIPAGFPIEPLWLSTASLLAGETVEIFTVVYNESGKKITGTVVFKVDETEVGAKDFSLESGKSQILSAGWTAVAGSHSISAIIRNASDAGLTQMVTLSNAAAGSRTITVAEPPPPSQAAQTAQAVSNVVSSIVASSTPAVVAAAQAVYGAAESLRQQGAAYFENQIALNDSGQANEVEETYSAILGTSTRNSDFSVATSTSWWKKAVSSFNAAGLALFRSATLFYPLLVLLILALFYFLARRVRRNSDF